MFLLPCDNPFRLSQFHKMTCTDAIIAVGNNIVGPSYISKTVIIPILKVLLNTGIDEVTKAAINDYLDTDRIDSENYVKLGVALKNDITAKELFDKSCESIDLFVSSKKHLRCVTNICDTKSSNSSKKVTLSQPTKRVKLLETGSETELGSDEVMGSSNSTSGVGKDAQFILDNINPQFAQLSNAIASMSQLIAANNEKFEKNAARLDKVEDLIVSESDKLRTFMSKTNESEAYLEERLSRFEERLSKIEERPLEAEAKLTDEEEFIQMIGRQENMRRKVERLRNRLEFIVAPNNFEQFIQKDDRNSEASSFIDKTKVELYLKSTFDEKCTLTNVAKSYMRGKKHVIIITFKFPNDTVKILNERKKLRVNKTDSTQNNSIQRILDKEDQKLFAFMVEMVKNKELSDVTITKGGFICISKGTDYRTLIDSNEVLYVKRNGLSSEDFAKLKCRSHFINSHIKLVCTPNRYLSEH